MLLQVGHVESPLYRLPLRLSFALQPTLGKRICTGSLLHAHVGRNVS